MNELKKVVGCKLLLKWCYEAWRKMSVYIESGEVDRGEVLWRSRLWFICEIECDGGVYYVEV